MLSVQSLAGCQQAVDCCVGGIWLGGLSWNCASYWQGSENNNSSKTNEEHCISFKVETVKMDQTLLWGFFVQWDMTNIKNDFHRLIKYKFQYISCFQKCSELCVHRQLTVKAASQTSWKIISDWFGMIHVGSSFPWETRLLNDSQIFFPQTSSAQTLQLFHWSCQSYCLITAYCLHNA